MKLYTISGNIAEFNTNYINSLESNVHERRDKGGRRHDIPHPYTVRKDVTPLSSAVNVVDLHACNQGLQFCTCIPVYLVLVPAALQQIVKLLCNFRCLFKLIVG